MKREEDDANVDHDIEYQEMQKLVSYLYKYHQMIINNNNNSNSNYNNHNN